jgi:uncharacterized protein YaiI (UPF0178 family)
MKIWIDADAAPQDVKEIVARAAARTETPAVFVANTRVWLPPGNDWVQAERVGGGPDAADDHIADTAAEGDIAVTADIPLAARLVESGVQTIDPRGEEYTPQNIGERLSIRDFMADLRSTGVDTGGHGAWGAREKQAFASTFDRVLTAAVRRRERRRD